MGSIGRARSMANRRVSRPRPSEFISIQSGRVLRPEIGQRSGPSDREGVHFGQLRESSWGAEPAAAPWADYVARTSRITSIAGSSMTARTSRKTVTFARGISQESE